MIIKLTTGKSKCTCFMYYISIKDNTIIASGNGVEFKVASIYK